MSGAKFKVAKNQIDMCFAKKSPFIVMSAKHFFCSTLRRTLSKTIRCFIGGFLGGLFVFQTSKSVWVSVAIAKTIEPLGTLLGKRREQIRSTIRRTLMGTLREILREF